MGPGRAGLNVSSREQTWLEQGATVREPLGRAGEVSGSQPGGAVSALERSRPSKRVCAVQITGVGRSREWIRRLAD